MTASITTPRSDAAVGGSELGILPGFGGLLRKELTEWRRARRTWVVFVISAAFMALVAMNAWLQVTFADGTGTDPVPAAALDPMMNLATAVSSQIFLIAAIFAVIALITAERESGTLAWTASKPVSRSAIWLAKFAAATLVLWAVAAVVPLTITAALIVALYGPLPLGPLAFTAGGMGLVLALYVAVALSVGTVFTSQAAVAGITLAVSFLPQLLGLVVPPEFLPTSILEWSLASASGQPAGLLTPVVWAVSVMALVVLATRRLERLEL
jgi:ABC-type transport system involved in multi-copper enzyme maturation permease subunit